MKFKKLWFLPHLVICCLWICDNNCCPKHLSQLRVPIFHHTNNLALENECSNTHHSKIRIFSVASPQPYWQNYYPPLADMVSWAVWFKFLLNKVIVNTCLFILTSISKQSASWQVLEICELCALSTDSRKTYSVNKYMYTGSSSYSFDWGGGE